MQRLGVVQRQRRQRTPLAEHEWWLSDLQRLVGVPKSTLHAWRQREWLQARWHTPTKRWVVWADMAELERIKQLHALPAGYYSRQQWRDADGYQAPTAPVG
jgi:hypothetical protein